MEEFQYKYIEDANDLIVNLETDLLTLEHNPKDKEGINSVFRVMHTLKGTAAMFGFEKVGNLTHNLESIYDYIRNGEMELSTEILSLTFSSIDLLKFLINNGENLDSKQQKKYNDQLNLINSHKIGSDKQVHSGTKKLGKTGDPFMYYYIMFIPDIDIINRGVNPLNIFDEIKELGAFISITHLIKTPELSEIEIDKSFTAWEIFLISKSEPEEIEDLFIFMLEEEHSIFQIIPETIESNQEFMTKHHEFEKKYNFAGINALKAIFSQLKSINIDSDEDTKDDTKDDSTKQMVAIAEKQEVSNRIRVSSEKLDDLINLVSELVTVRSQLDLLATQIKNSRLSKVVEEISKLSKRFRDNALNLRLVPIKILMVKFQRLVRDLSLQLNKEVEFVTVGMDTELDKNVINQLESPLMHIIRNSIDHGIEMPEVRLKQGKPTKGMIRLIAFYEGSQVVIQVQDDGGGIDMERIRRKAIDNGFIKPEHNLTKEEVYKLIFQPGFSTAQSLTSVSGRGVGMDVVRQKINDLRGDIEIESEKNLGTSFTLKLPLTLSIIDTLHVRVGHQSYLLPLSFIISCELTTDAILNKSSNKQIEYNNNLIPYIDLREEFGIKGEAEKKKLVIISVRERPLAFVVDSIHGEYQAVVKSLGEFHKNNQYLSGASILGDGTLALILDVTKFYKKKNMNLKIEY